MTASEALRPLFEPRSVAVVGVSRSGKPVLYALTGDFGPGFTADYLADHGVVSAPSAERALRAYARLALR
jgi:acyl-CoA synthetase (NDP forming)